MDTGAYASSIHCTEIYINDDNTVHFKLLDDSHPDYSHQDIVMPIYKVKKVKSSNGTYEERVFIKTTISLFGKKIKTRISLTNRADMKYPMLIGRLFLNEHFIVDTSLKYQTEPKRINDEDLHTVKK